MKSYHGDLFDVPVTIQDADEASRDCKSEWYSAGIQLVDASGNALAVVMYDTELERRQAAQVTHTPAMTLGPCRPGLTFEEAQQVAKEAEQPKTGEPNR